jgi:CHAT domain-containing protein
MRSRSPRPAAGAAALAVARLALLCWPLACGGGTPSGGAAPTGGASPGAAAGGAGARTWIGAASRPIERPMRPGETHSYGMALPAGQFVHVVVDQLGSDVELRLYAPGGALIDDADSPTGATGPERVSEVAAQSGSYRLDVVAAPGDDPPGRYRLTVVTWRQATPADRLEVAAERAFDRGEALRRQGKPRAALAPYQAALAAWRALGAGGGQAEALYRLGWMHQDMGEPAPAVDLFHQALVAYAKSGIDAALQAELYNRLGRALLALYRFDEALDAHRKALAGFRRLADPQGIATSLNNEGSVYHWLGKNQLALEAYDAALALWGRRRATASERMKTLINQGDLLVRQEKLDEAAASYQEATAIAGRLGDRRGLARGATAEGYRLSAAGEPEAAIAALGQAAALHQQLHDTAAYGKDLLGIGRAHLKRQDLVRATAAFNQAREVFQQFGGRQGLAMCAMDLGTTLYDAGDLPRSLASYDEAGRQFAAIHDRQGVVSTDYGAARTLLRLGRLREARDRTERAVAGLEDLRGETASQSLRLSYFSSRQAYWDLYIEILMRLDALDRGAGYAAQAFAVSERRRSRALLDLVSGAASHAPPVGAASEAAHEERDLEARLSGLAAKRQDLLERKGGEASLPALDRLEQDLVVRLDRARAQAARLGGAEAVPAPVAEVAAVQTLLAGDDVLLEYSLSEPASYVWAITRAHCRVFRLAGRARIEAAARAAVAGVTRASRQAEDAWAASAAQLSALVLAPLASELGQARLLLVADGALDYVPFAALPDPGAGGKARLLVERHEIVTVPSASVLAALRERTRQRPPGVSGVAVLADPVFRADDPRVAGNSSAAAPRLPPPAAGDPSLLLRDVEAAAGLPRLAATHDEAAAIRLVGPPGTVVEEGFAATREHVIDGSLRRFRYVHFATHSLIDVLHPDLSGMVLSLVDEHGRPRDGFLRLYEIYDLDLQAQLVVLSGCESGLGKPVAGEGLVGLSWGFLHAGSQGVLVSLWNVLDGSTAELMGRFYKALFSGHATIPAALRQAQLSMLAEPKWRAPYHWAGFVLTGDCGAGAAP